MLAGLSSDLSSVGVGVGGWETGASVAAVLAAVLSGV